jgi:hypothetical protein
MNATRIRLLGLLPLALAFAGCGSGGHESAGVLAARAKFCAAGSYRTLGSTRVAYAAFVRSHALAYRRPGRRCLRGAP